MQPLQRTCNVVGTCALLCLLLGAMQSRADRPGPGMSSLELSIPYTLGSDQQHLCTVTKVDSRNERYIVTFEPHLQPGHVRHLSLQLCDIIPADALKAVSAYVPLIDTGIPLGGPLGQDYLLMQVHLKETDAEKTDHEDSKVDKSESVTERVSLVINTTATRPLLEFGLAILQNTGFIPKGSEVVTTESACQWQSEQPVVIAGIRLHTHSRGRLTGERNARGPASSSWTEEMCNLHVLYLLPIGAAPSIRFQLCTNQVPSIALRHLFPNLPSLRTDISPEPEDREVGM
ncbi:hypothetical protein C0Q70_08127 [Pomacea canaliculata]|uniref:Uncharacterized protein n=1 Tax=Pomacea canaliculata TaxID=400727 RepID=A0A2T7PGY7_POMCA|nr:hypothetical protein C0Q70_08127 [Pomacea canaliculata]